MTDTDPCEICGTQAETVSTGGYDGIRQRCPRCGEFRLTGTGETVIRSLCSPHRIKLSGYVRDQNALGEVPELTSARIKLLSAAPLPGLINRADRLLSYAVRNQKKLGESFNLNDPALIAVTYSQDINELLFLARFLSSEGLIKMTTLGGEAEINPSGHMRYETLQAESSSSAQGFVAMWFDSSMVSAYEVGFEKGIRQAGYDPVRVDRVEHIGKIDDEIVAQIRRSRFVVADFTGQRAGVYFEAGFAQGLNLPVIWCCRRADISNLHFDIRQFNCIDWTEPAELADRLQKRIEAIIGAGPRALFGE